MDQFSEEWQYRLALKMLPGIGDKMHKLLVANCGSAREVFNQKPRILARIPGVGAKVVGSIKKADLLHEAEAELRFMEDHQIKAWYYLDREYPQRLKLCDDGPVCLFNKGNIRPNQQRLIAMVGSRGATAYGLEFCERFIAELKAYNPMIVSGLAYGIDIQCHREALRNGLPTAAVLAHGLNQIYPFLHKKEARLMQEEGGLISEFGINTKPDRENFPKRNRIVAGMCDAVVVVEAAARGGALITADIANSYNREVFAVPGRLGDTFSEGCNQLIKTHRASLLTKVEDLGYLLGWERESAIQPKQQRIEFELPTEERIILSFLNERDGRGELAVICHSTQQPVSAVLRHLMNLELKGLVKSLPGQLYALSHQP